MSVRRHPHSIRFSQDEWESVVQAAAQHKMAPGEYVREATVRTVAEASGFSDTQLPPELIELLKRTFRGVHVLAYLKREQLVQAGRQDEFDTAATAARTAQSATLQADNRSEKR